MSDHILEPWEKWERACQKLEAERDMHFKNAGEFMHRLEQTEAKLAAVVEALDRVLTESGLQAHKHGCPNRVMRPAQWDQFKPCAGCQAEAALAQAKG